MEIKGVSSRNFRSIFLTMLICGSVLNGVFTVGQDVWISLIVMAVLYLPLLAVYSRICVLFPGKSLFEIVEELFGKVGGWLITFLMAAYFLAVAGIQLRVFTEFTLVVALRETPPVPIMIMLMLAVLYLAGAGVEVLGRWVFVVIILLFLTLSITLVLSMNILDWTYMLPILNHSFSEILESSQAMGCIAVGETVALMALLGELQKGRSPYRVYIPGLLMGTVLFLLIILRNLFILGPSMVQAAKFSTYTAVRIIGVGRFLERPESSISLVYLLLGIGKLSVFVIAASMGTTKLLRVAGGYKKTLIPTGLLVLALGTLVFKNIFEMFDLLRWYRYGSLPFQVGIPLIIWLVAEFKTGRRAVAGQKSPPGEEPSGQPMGEPG